MLSFNIAMTVNLLIISLFCFLNLSDAVITFLLIFVILQQMSSATIVWLYMAEMMDPKGISITMFLYYAFLIAQSVYIPYAVH